MAMNKHVLQKQSRTLKAVRYIPHCRMKMHTRRHYAPCRKEFGLVWFEAIFLSYQNTGSAKTLVNFGTTKFVKSRICTSVGKIWYRTKYLYNTIEVAKRLTSIQTNPSSCLIYMIFLLDHLYINDLLMVP